MALPSFCTVICSFQPAFRLIEITKTFISISRERFISLNRGQKADTYVKPHSVVKRELSLAYSVNLESVFMQVAQNAGSKNAPQTIKTALHFTASRHYSLYKIITSYPNDNRYEFARFSQDVGITVTFSLN